MNTIFQQPLQKKIEDHLPLLGVQSFAILEHQAQSDVFLCLVSDDKGEVWFVEMNGKSGAIEWSNKIEQIKSNQ